jgi:hypothetical protein
MVSLKRKHRCSLLPAGLLAVLACAACHAEFAMPAEGPVAFRRDRVPLDAETMAGLSKNLTTMARAHPMATPAERRTIAQQLALAQALDPGNAAGRELMAACRDGGHTPHEDAAGRDRSLAKIRQLATWLRSPEAGADGQALAACLQDILGAADSGETAAAFKETGAWAGWVPELAAYEPRPEQPAVDDPFPTPDRKDRPAPGMASASIGMLAWKRSGDESHTKWSPAAATLQMAASQADDPDAPFTIRIFPADEARQQTARMLEGLMRRHHGNPPSGIRLRISSSDFKNTEWGRKPLAFSAAAAVLCSAAITGREPDAIMLGEVDATGAYRAPEALWEQLGALGHGGGKRLVLPASTAGLLPSLLAVGKPGFFMDYEVLLARDFQHLLDLTAKQPPEAVAAASAKFHAIRSRMGTEDVRSYVANRFVRPRLGELAQEAPWHASAALLFTQASGQRPTVISRAALAAELMRACSELSWIAETEDRDLDVSEIDQLAKYQGVLRKRLDELSGLAVKTDHDLIESSRALIQPLRDIERASRGRGDYDMQIGEVWRARGNLIRLLRQVEKSLAEEARKLARQ